MNIESMRAFVFPGQGVQEHIHKMANSLIFNDMQDIATTARRTYEEADDALRMQIRNLSLKGPVEKLSKPGVMEPAILTASIAAFRILKDYRGIEPSVVAGHSMGEFSAVVAAGVLDFPQTLKVVKGRGEFMEQASHYNSGRMIAAIRLTPKEIEEVCRRSGVEFANDNAPGQVVFSGDESSIDRAVKIIDSLGKKSIGIAVMVAAHSSHMEPAKREMEALLQGMDFNDPSVKFIQNVTGSYAATGEQVRRGLIDQMTERVRWVDTVHLMSESVGSYVEVGPGNVLSGLIRRIDPNALAVHAMQIIENSEPALI